MQSFPTPETLSLSGHEPLCAFKVERAAPPCPWAGGEKVYVEDSVVH